MYLQCPKCMQWSFDLNTYICSCGFKNYNVILDRDAIRYAKGESPSGSGRQIFDRCTNCKHFTIPIYPIESDLCVGACVKSNIHNIKKTKRHRSSHRHHHVKKIVY